MQTKIYYFFFAILLLTDAAVGQLVYQEEDTNENRKPQGHVSVLHKNYYSSLDWT